MDIICLFRQLVLLRLIISVMDNWNYRTLLISTIGIVDITNTNCQYRQSVLLRLCITHLDHWNCRYQ